MKRRMLAAGMALLMLTSSLCLAGLWKLEEKLSKEKK